MQSESTLVKRVMPMVSIVEKLVAVRDKITKDASDIPGLIKAATDVKPLIGAANFELNMWHQDNIKLELTCNEEYNVNTFVLTQYPLRSLCLVTILICLNS